MVNKRSDRRRILAVAPNIRGFGFAVLEGTDRLVDWGVVHVRQNKHDGCLERIRELATRYRPGMIACEDHENSRHRGARIRKLLTAIQAEAVVARIKCKGFSRAQIREVFRVPGRSTKYAIAHGIAERFPELAPRLPPPRKPWMSEDSRMAIFQAVALALTLTHLPKRQAAKK